MLPEVTDYAVVQYARKVLDKNIGKAMEDLRVVGRVASEAAILSHIFHASHIGDIKADLAEMAVIDFTPPGNFPVLILRDRYTLLLKEGAVINVLYVGEKCPEPYVTVLDKKSYGRNLGRMHIQPKPYTAKEMQDIARRMKHDRDLAPANIVRQAVRYGETV